MLLVRQADVFTTYVAYSSHEIGRLIQAVEGLGKLESTLIIYIVGNNCSGTEGDLKGTPSEARAISWPNVIKDKGVFASSLTRVKTGHAQEGCTQHPCDLLHLCGRD